MAAESFAWLLNYFRPSAYLKSLGEIDLAGVKRQGVKWVICDLDNTLAPHYSRVPTRAAVAFKQRIEAAGLQLAVASNNSKERVSRFCQALGQKLFVYNCKKPLVRRLKRFMIAHNISPAECVVVGDQFITDVLAANRLKCRSILVLPVFSPGDDPDQTTFARFLDRQLYKRLSQKNMLATAQGGNDGMKELNEIL